jgi:hypothetical protein
VFRPIPLAPVLGISTTEQIQSVAGTMSEPPIYSKARTPYLNDNNDLSAKIDNMTLPSFSVSLG